jgi:hypothetical protein
VFASPDAFEVVDVPRPVREQVIVADAFHVKPLLRVARTAERFQVLCLTREHVRLLEGDRNGLEPVELRGVPATVVEALGDVAATEQRNQPVAGRDANHPDAAAAPQGPMNHAAKGNDAKIDAERFFRAVDRAVWEHHSRSSGLPLLVAAVPENQAMFRAVAHNQNLLTAGIDHNPDALSLEQLRAQAWQAIEPFHRQRLAKLIEDFGTAKARGLASDNLEEAARAANAGRVGTLLVDADYQVAGVIDRQTGEPVYADPAAPGMADDLLDDLAELVLRMKGDVHVLPGGAVPGGAGVAAIYRF